jgi:serine/threonine protein kinase
MRNQVGSRGRLRSTREGTRGARVQDVKRIAGRYEILGQLGEGGMATVYLARQLDLDRLVALKELRALSSSDPSFAQRFLREARMAGSLSHPNIVTVHDYFESEGTPFIAMEYIENGSLRPHIGHMSLAQVGGVLEGLLAGLDYAGGRGIVHRDIKPENVMVSSDGRVKIADFGIAKATYAFQTGGSLTAEGTALGTPNYMAPEQALAEEVGTFTDIYATGVMAFEFFVGRPPFADTPQPLVVIMRQVKDPLPLVTDLDPSIDPRIAGWIAWLTSKEPSDRPQTAGQAWDAFEEILIAILGPRWQRDSRLMVAEGATAQVAPAYVTPPPSVTTRTPSQLTTRGLDEAALAATVAPNPAILGIDHTEALSARPPSGPGTSTGPPNRRKWTRAAIALVGVALVAALAVAALRPSSSPAPTTAARSPAARQPAAPAPAPTQTAAKAAVTKSTSSPDAAAGTLKSQATQARRLARQYNSGAARIEGLPATGAKLDSNALIAALMRKTARSYSTAARAAARGDAQGYATALAAALAAKGQLDDAARRAAAPSSAAGQSGAAPSKSSCAGDSTSDDPSDDSCGGEP